VEVTSDQLRGWRERGYEDWLKQQQRLADMKVNREFALELAKANKGKALEEAALQVAAAQIYEVLMNFDATTLKEKLAGDPVNYTRLIHALAKLSDGGLKYERYRAEV